MITQEAFYGQAREITTGDDITIVDWSVRVWVITPTTLIDVFIPDPTQSKYQGGPLLYLLNDGGVTGFVLRDPEEQDALRVIVPGKYALVLAGSADVYIMEGDIA